MNPYQIVGIIAGCLLMFSGVVTLLVGQGMPVMLAFSSVYAVALLFMLAMQRRARQSCDIADEFGHRASVDRPRDDLADGGGAGGGIATLRTTPPRAAVETVCVRY